MKLLRQKTSGEIYIWDEELAKREDMEDYVKSEVQSEPVPVEQAEIEVTEVPEIEVTAPEEVVNEEEASVGSTESEEAKPEAKPKAKSRSKSQG